MFFNLARLSGAERRHGSVPTPPRRAHANDNRGRLLNVRVGRHGRALLACRWRADPTSGKLVGRWAIEGDGNVAAEPSIYPPGRRPLCPVSLARQMIERRVPLRREQRIKNGRRT